MGIRKPIDRFNFSRDEPDHYHPLIEYASDTSPTFRMPGDWNSPVRELAWYEDLNGEKIGEHENATRTLTWDSARALPQEANALGANFVRTPQCSITPSTCWKR